MAQRKRRETVEVIPSARRLTESLRDVGYEFVEAIADLVDNSIAAGARTVDVDLRFEGPDSSVRIADDGTGMAGTVITEAMKFGSEREYDPEDLGKFGLGLKIASLSQCRRLTVASRTATVRARIEARQLDLDHVERTDAWEVFVLRPDERREELVRPLRDHTGTVVMWENLDRVLTYKHVWGEWARSRMLALAEQVDVHLGMVFHRFLAGEVPPRRKLTIRVNGTRVEPWDPFARSEPHTEALTPKEFEVVTPDGAGLVRVEPYVLPPRHRFSSETAFQRASGPNRWNRQQGFYVYRAHRLIQSGGWSRMRTQDEHSKLARMGLSFFPDVDEAFGINLAKMRVTLPADFRDQIKPLVDQTVRRAQVVYRQKEKSATAGGRRGGRGRGSGNGATAETHGDGAGSATSGDGSVGPGAASQNGTSAAARAALEAAAAEVHQEEALKRIIETLAMRYPEVARELGW